MDENPVETGLKLNEATGWQKGETVMVDAHMPVEGEAAALKTVCLSFLTEKLHFVSQEQTVWPKREAAQVMGWV